MAHKDNFKDIQNAMSRVCYSKCYANFDPEEGEVFSRWLRIIKDSGIPFMVGGAFAVHAYTGIWRDTKDLDIFLMPKDLKKALDALRNAGFETEITYRHWLAKVRYQPYFMDLIFGVWNGQLEVDESWFEYSRPVDIAGVDVQLIPLEEMLTSKIYVAARDRFDGSDVVHLIRSTKGEIDWERVMTRLNGNSQLLLWHLILFDFVYPRHTDYVPRDLVLRLFEEMQERWKNTEDLPKFRGTLLDPFSYEVDLKDWGYEDTRKMKPTVDEEGNLLHSPQTA